MGWFRSQTLRPGRAYGDEDDAATDACQGRQNPGDTAYETVNVR